MQAAAGVLGGKSAGNGKPRKTGHEVVLNAASVMKKNTRLTS